VASIAVGMAPQSGRIEARTGLRMMPTSPRSPLSGEVTEAVGTGVGDIGGGVTGGAAVCRPIKSRGEGGDGPSLTPRVPFRSNRL